MKYFIYHLKQRIKYFLFPRTYIISKQSRFNRKCAFLIKSILENNGINIMRIYFTDITAKSTKKKVIITCTMLRPGVFIGRAGSTIDMVNKYLSDYFGKEVVIHIKEKTLWW